MKEIFDKERYVDIFARIFVLAVDNRIHFQVITNTLSDSTLVKNIEHGNYSELTSNSVVQLFEHYFNIPVMSDFSLYNYNDAYWCGYVYMNIFYSFNKPLSYIFLKLPLAKLIDLYPVFHETDISQIYELFTEAEKNSTILALLLKKHACTLTELSKITGISRNVLKKYKANDLNLYKGSFSNIHRIALALDEPDNLFLETL